MSKHSVEGQVIQKIFRVDTYMCSGAFGALYSGTHLKTNQILAIKFEAKDIEKPTLPLEYQIYSQLGRFKGLPEVYYFGPCGLFNVIVMEMLGPTLEKMHRLCGQKFSADTTAKVAQQILPLIEFIHNKKIIFRDIKPENFLLGLDDTPKANTIHLIDFGLAKEYVDKTGKHLPMILGKGLTGTPRYMSIHSHSRKEQSRRDDMESIGYMLIFFVRGSLPWQGLKGTKTERYDNIGQVKRNTTIDVLCEQIPKPFADYMKNVKKLNFEDKPNYKELYNYFNQLIDNKVKYDWQSKRQGSDTSSQTSTQSVGQKTIR